MAPWEISDAIADLVAVEMSIENHFKKWDNYQTDTKLTINTK